MTDPMLTTHGRAGGRGKSWCATALVALGLAFVVEAGQPAKASQINHQGMDPSASWGSTSWMPDGATPPDDAMELQSFMKRLHSMHPHSDPMMPVTPPTPTPMPTAPLPQAEAQVMMPMPASSTSTPSVSTWHQSTASTCMPPPPTCSSDSSPTNATQAMNPPSTASSPSSLLNPPTTAPEPSTLSILFGLAAGLVWRARRKS